MAFEKEYELVKQTIQKYPEQVKQAWEEVRSLHLPNEYKDVQNIVFCGMGGSALGARIVKSFSSDRMELPFEIYNEYRIPSYVNDKTLVIISSYSGTTEETLANLEFAKRKRAKIFGITSGGLLAETLSRDNISCYIFDPKHNPSKQPRLSIGYAAGAVFALFSALSYFKLTDDEIYKSIAAMQEAVAHFSDETSAENTAFNLSQKLLGHIPILVASEHLFGTAYTIKNQFNESAKTLCALFELPELNHHLMEGLAHPSNNKDLLHFVFFNSPLYTSRTQKRYPLTQEVVTKNEIQATMFSPTSLDGLSQVFESLVFGSFVVYYLTRSYNIDPIAIPWVDYFKKELAKI